MSNPPDKQAVYYRTHRENHPRSRQVYRALAKARRAGLVADLTVQAWERIVADYDDCCAYCLEHDSHASLVCVEGFGLHLDHIIPLSQGGGTTERNVVPCCYSCNQAKRHPGWTPSIASRMWPFENMTERVKGTL